MNTNAVLRGRSSVAAKVPVSETNDLERLVIFAILSQEDPLRILSNIYKREVYL